MKVADVAIRLEVSVHTIYGLISSGQLPCNRIGTGRGVIRISEDQLREYLDANRRNAPAVVPPSALQPAPPPMPKFNLKHIKLDH